MIVCLGIAEKLREKASSEVDENPINYARFISLRYGSIK